LRLLRLPGHFPAAWPARWVSPCPPVSPCPK
jgi:hypothetical protein